MLGLAVLAGPAARAQQPAPTAYPLTLHVTRSRLVMVTDNSTSNVRGVDLLDLLHGTLGGKKLVLAELVHDGFWGHRHPLLVPGDYAVRLKQSKQTDPGELDQTYELRLANGKTRLLFLWGMSE
jgi:hypothetical protein